MLLVAVGILAIQTGIGSPAPGLKLSPFYKKCLMVQGLPIVSSDKTSDLALQAAAKIVDVMLRKRPELIKPMIDRKLRIAIMAHSEQTLDIPEHSDLQKAFPETDWNKRARGLGATLERPCISRAEENLLGLPGDRYKGECILIHEFGHTVLNFGLEVADKGFRPRVQKAFESAKKSGVWKNTYAMTNLDEYWAEGVQSWFDSNQKGPQGGNGVHNEIWNRTALKAADPALYDLLSEVFVQDWKWTLPGSKK
jgi:hypothetical protein